MGANYTITELTRKHNRKGFDCGNHELNGFLATQARVHKSRHISKTFVAERVDNPNTILGFYTILPCETDGALIPGNYPSRVPAYLLGRLAIDKRYHGRGLGGELLISAIHKAALASRYVGGIGVFVDAKAAEARKFYLHMGFEQLPDQTVKLFMPMERCRKLFD
ncbi:FIG001353: Acetyltransferase [hydrothermal vent metagenome]|uniref:FIG001353: Acetyltransferase n=1 Tax=hydrothermal vent metagenome TaxID=652676 RepID=A0A3B1BKF6_9ZZZZ